jgi:2-polyprenyl-3-methyl-5-hydroxy-6-metoxy-1,4-benzoquinol methylase
MASELARPQTSNIAGNYYDKHGTPNPLARLLVAGFYRAFDALLRESGARTVHELGCGEGVLSLRAASAGCVVTGSDLEASVIAEANRRARAAGYPALFATGDLYATPPGSLSNVDLVVCCEVLEHLPDPRAALAVLEQSGAPLVLMSVPREPLWRVLNVARLRYLGAWGNTPGHLNHWSRRGFLSVVRESFDVVSVRSPIPWTFVLARPRRRR